MTDCQAASAPLQPNNQSCPNTLTFTVLGTHTPLPPFSSTQLWPVKAVCLQGGELVTQLVTKLLSSLATAVLIHKPSPQSLQTVFFCVFLSWRINTNPSLQSKCPLLVSCCTHTQKPQRTSVLVLLSRSATFGLMILAKTNKDRGQPLRQTMWEQNKKNWQKFDLIRLSRQKKNSSLPT